MVSRDRWVDEGMSVLREQGAAGIRVDRIAARLGLTKGSFHHHFRGIAGYQEALLGRYEELSRAAIEQAVGSVEGASGREAIMRLPRNVSIDATLDAAVRSWAFQDDRARASMQRIDEARFSVLLGFWHQAIPDASRARIAALVPHLMMIGASAAIPPLGDEELRAVLEMIAAAVPNVE